MTKQQFLDKLIYESDRIIYDEHGNIIEVGVGVFAYLNKQANDNYQQQHGVRVPSWDQYFFYAIRCKAKKKNGVYIFNDVVYNGYETEDVYCISTPPVSAYKQFAADIENTFIAGESGLTITQKNGNTYFIPYSDIKDIGGCLMQSTELKDTPFRHNVGRRVYYSGEHIGFLGSTPAVMQMDLTHAIRRTEQTEHIV